MIDTEKPCSTEQKTETKKNEIDLSFVPIDPNGEKIFDTEVVNDSFGQPVIRTDGRALTKEIGEPKTMKSFCLMALKAPIESDKDKGIDELRKCMRLIRRIEKYGDKPMSLKTENWIFIRERMLKVNPALRFITAQFDILIEGEPSDEELATL